MKNNEVLDALSEAIESTISHFIDRDAYYFIAPYLSKKPIGMDCPFFGDNRISLTAETEVLPEGNVYPSIHEYPSNLLYPSLGIGEAIPKQYTNDELRTISYLAPFQRSRVAYNPKNIDYYLRTLGHIEYSQSAMEILCFNGGECGNENENISYQEWLSLS